jgi:nucleoid-associated protein YgaU
VPPFVTFRWGSVDLPKSVPVTLTIQHVLFHPNGEPIRAMVDLELAQAEKASTASSGSANQPQNPTTRALRGLKVHRVHDGDSLPAIAYDNYGDPTRWRAIAEANNIDDPLRLRRGDELRIPRIEA